MQAVHTSDVQFVHLGKTEAQIEQVLFIRVYPEKH